MASKKIDLSIYNYPHLKFEYYATGEFPGPKVGEQAIDFSVSTLDGQTVKLSDYLGQPLVLETGSIFCPIYIQNLPDMNQLAQAFPEVKFLLLYVREAHPGSKIPAHHTMEQKINNAKQLQNAEPEKRAILVDDINGSAHKIYGSGADMVYIFNSNGQVMYRADWSDPARVKKVLQELAQGKNKIDPNEINTIKRSKSFLSRLPIDFRVFKRTGFDAMVDLYTQMISVLFRPKIRKLAKPK